MRSAYNVKSTCIQCEGCVMCMEYVECEGCVKCELGVYDCGVLGVCGM